METGLLRRGFDYGQMDRTRQLEREGSAGW